MTRAPLLLSLIAISLLAGCGKQIGASVDSTREPKRAALARQQAPVTVDSRLIHLLPGAPSGAGPNHSMTRAQPGKPASRLAQQPDERNPGIKAPAEGDGRGLESPLDA